MLLFLSEYHSKKIAFLFAYLFFVSGLCSVVYGNGYYGNTVNGSAPVPRSWKEKSPVQLAVKADNKPVNKNYRGGKTIKAAASGTPAPFKKTDMGGPTQPEMTAFKPVGADNMVDPFTGDFSYNIPLINVGGYGINIFYNSGISMDQEASWTGLGWNINPGTISRNMRGLPDDFNGQEKITKTQYTKPDKTYGVNIGGRVEIFGGALGIGLDGGIFYNNMRGLGLEAGINPAISIGGKSGDDKTASLSFGWKLNANSQSGGSSTFNIALGSNSKKGLNGSLSASIGTHSRQGLQALHLTAEAKLFDIQTKSQYINAAANNLLNPSLSTSISFAYPSFMPSMRGRTSSENYDLDLGFGGALGPVFGHGRLGGYYTRRYIKPDDVTFSQPAYGLIYQQNGMKDKNALMDFNRLNDGVYTPGTPAISIPIYTYDVFSMSGEGTGGSFRAYRGDLGYMQDAFLENSGHSAHLGVELGAGAYGHGAINANLVMTPSKSGGWDRGNMAKNTLAFREGTNVNPSVYFKNPGEKAIPDINWQNAVGGEDLVRLKMINTGFGSPTLTNTLVRYTDMLQRKNDHVLQPAATLKQRDKRTQVISTLTAEEADRVGLNKMINYIKLEEADSTKVVFGCSNTNRESIRRFDSVTRQKHHISEIDVLMQDGRRYVYDIPVYNLLNKEVTFNKKGSAGGNGPNNPTIGYDKTKDIYPEMNSEGKDGFVEIQQTPPYAHSYLLGGLLSPNYVDVKGDGITEDDMGDAIKFNYAKSKDNLKWRTPNGANIASMNEGLKTDKDDDKAHYIYGEREAWYLYSVESKNMVARFYVKNDRKDSRAVLDEHGAMDLNYGAFRLSKISLFTKGELLKHPDNPKPVKSVIFEYDQSLCKNAPGSINGEGKLTLRGIYFTYNGNNKVKKNYYRFNYPTGITGNPDYSFVENDRWGNYKPETNNPGGLKNADFPYTEQNAANTNGYVQAWTMNEVILPSGAAIKVEYESDDYAYVQDRRASNMFTIYGFGTTSGSASTSNKLYDGNSSSYDYIYIQVPKAITATTPAAQTQQIKDWYLGNILKSRQLYMKLAVNMPTDPRGSGYEMIPIYAELENEQLYNDVVKLVPGSTNIISLRIKRLSSNYSPMVHYALQYLKSNLPSKAYPGYDVTGEGGGIKQVVKAMGGLFHSFKEIFNGGFKLMIAENKCRYVELNKSFIRLTDPNLKKLGGGIRVKKVVINDNFDKLTKSTPTAEDGMANATYGQEYFYTKKELVNGVLTEISSGVANWEPAMGADENPHRQALEFYNKTPKADYDYRVMEIPFAEMLYPSAMVGYSRVETRSIHRDTVKNAAGISVSEFYTSREFPTTSLYTPLSEYNAEDRYESGALDKLLKTDLKTAVALSQGFKVDLNDMNGKMKKQSTYSPLNLNDPISYTENFYSMVKTGDQSFKLNHDFPVIAGSEGKISQSLIGREVEVMTDFREHNQQTITTNINFNIDIINAVFFPIPIPTNWKPVVKEANTYRSASMMKVVNHYAILDSVVAVDKGSMVSTKNLVYDAETGEPLLTRTNNEHNKPIYNFTYPAHWAYSGMGLAYKNIDVEYKNVVFRYGKLDNASAAGVDFGLFESGDEIMVTSQPTQGPAGVAPCDAPGSLLAKSNVKKIWAINTAKVGSLTPQWLFLDADGNPYTADKVTMRIIRSGKRNMFATPVGSVTSLSSPVNPATGQLAFTDNTEIIQTSSAVFKDHWRVDDVFFKKDSLVTTTVQARVRRKDIYLTDNVTASMYQKTTNSPQYWSAKQTYALTSKRSKNGNFFNRSEKWLNRSFLLFDFAPAGIPSNANLYKSFLSLFSHTHPYGGNSVHPGLHGNTVSQTTGIQGLINTMRGNWFAATDANNWGNTYMGADNNVSAATTFIPNSQTGAENYSFYNNNWLDITGLVNANSGTTLGLTQKLGLQLKIFNDKTIDGGSLKHRCFWTSYIGKNFTNPFISYYYYVCGDNASYNNYYNDPYENTLINCYSYSVPATFCLSKFTQRKSVNPYVEGIWGNWRTDSTFVYYGERKESTVTGSPVDLRKGGTIIGYKNFWNFTASNSQYLGRNYSASDVWSWNSVITQYNRKGYEIENKDPLGRFNAGLYGYAQQLPIAVINNSRYMESMFDGFEDYGYQSTSCTETCKPRKHVNMGNITPDPAQKHSGKNSLKVNANSTFTFSAPVVPVSSLNRDYAMRVKVDSTGYSETTVTPAGTGLTGRYLKYSANNNNNAMTAAANTAINNILTSPSTVTRTDAQINMVQNQTAMQPPVGWGKFVARWDGFIQALETGVHQFRTYSNDGIRVWIGGSQIINRWTTGSFLQGDGSFPMTKGQTYSLRVEYFDTYAGGQANLLWRSPVMQSYSMVPGNVLYVNENQAANTVNTTTGWCTKTDSVNVRGNALTDTFTVVQGRKMLVSAWVKVGGNDCKCSTYTHNKIRISYNGSSTITDFTPAGSIIEGWQRYEGIFDIPATATQMNVSLMNTGSIEAAWFDDLRIHPFNANMKSFVYHPQNLRLMGELDENNYASFYEYDDDGTLTRVKKETINGVKTITETRSHLQKALQ